MSSHKNQHYVPRCLLKPFTADSKGGAINLYNISSRRFVECAPVKKQCSQNFFYGADLVQETALAELEGHYSRITKVLLAGGQISNSDVDWLRVFAIIQTRRTAQAIDRLRQFMVETADKVFINHPKQRPPAPTHDELVLASMKHGLHFANQIDDLKFTILANKTDLEFSISDHPAIISNRFHIERLNVNQFGLATSGSFLALPLAPRLIALFFDINVYTVSIPRGSQFVQVKSVADVKALNELQELNAEQNIYFSKWGDRERFVIGNERIAQQQKNKPQISIFVRDEKMPDGLFRKATASETIENRPKLLQSSSQHPRPQRWPSFLKIRKNPTTFSNGSSVGLVRKTKWLLPGSLNDHEISER